MVDKTITTKTSIPPPFIGGIWWCYRNYDFSLVSMEARDKPTEKVATNKQTNYITVVTQPLAHSIQRATARTVRAHVFVKCVNQSRKTIYFSVLFVCFQFILSPSHVELYVL
jgi:hypothetical protein